mmetsp:Transcript_108211/g.248131  ORF Transcript_108211/g.248131 Transcript_108211/m.248131 type:complete len:199 (+) Transcript_108211:50-646(+)
MEAQIKHLAIRFKLFEDQMADYIASTLADNIESHDSDAVPIESVEDILQLLLEYIPEDEVPDEEDFFDFCEDVFIAARPILDEGKEEEYNGFDDEDGLCEMCEREMPLTRHHLIPREEHKRYKKLGYSSETLNTVATICRPCHNAVHRFADNATLAADYNTVEKLMSTENLQRFVNWARKQKLRTKQDAMNPNIHYAR